MIHPMVRKARSGFSFGGAGFLSVQVCFIILAMEISLVNSLVRPGSRVGIVGGGLAGLSTAFHLLRKEPSLDVTILDSSGPGMGGASSVAGGLLHPLSPRGKLVHLGLEGLEATNQLINAARKFEEGAVLRTELFRVATNQEHSATLRETAANLPHLATWFGPSDKQGETWQTIFDREKSVVGALRLHSGCKVVHMPSYLKGLWSACNSIGRGKKEWIQNPNYKASGYDWLKNLVEFDAVVFAAGAGLFRTSIIQKDEDLPTQLVRGQSIEMVSNNEEDWLENALLCGKYVSPMLEKNRVLIGATHEFNKDPLDRHQVEEELKDRSHLFASYVWNGWTIDKITSGYRVQSNRGKHGRLPIIGRWKSPHHHNSWIFTGLSSRGLLYHGIFGDSLSDMMLGNLKDEDLKDYDWWRK